MRAAFAFAGPAKFYTKSFIEIVVATSCSFDLYGSMFLAFEQAPQFFTQSKNFAPVWTFKWRVIEFDT